MDYKNSEENAFTTGKQFYTTIIKPQKFSLPNTIMKYLWKYPSNPEGYKKLIQTCKFFFAKNPILICPYFCYEPFVKIEYWEYRSKYPNNYFNCFRKKINLEKIDCKLWILNYLNIRLKFPQNFLPKLYRCDAKDVSVHSKINYLKDVLLLTSSAKDLSLAACMLDNNGQQILLEDYIHYFPMLEKFCIYWDENNIIIPCKDYETVLKTLQKFPTFKKFKFQAVPDNFNIDTFLECVEHLKIHFQTEIYYFNESSSETHNRFLECIVDRLIETEKFDYCPPLIYSYYLDKFKLIKYDNLISKIDEYLSKKM